MNPWEWGWDALVALGTLALAAVTVLTLYVPAWRDADREQNRRARRAQIFALLIVDELIIAKSKFMMLRKFFNTYDRFDRDAWLYVAKAGREIDLPIFGKLVDRLDDCTDAHARDLAECFAVIARAKAQIEWIAIREYEDPDGKARAMIRRVLYSAQKRTNLACAVAWELSKRTSTLPVQPGDEPDVGELTNAPLTTPQQPIPE